MLVKAMLIAGGVINLMFVAFHVLLGYQIQHLAGVSRDLKALMLALNLGGSLCILFFAYASLFATQEVLGTRLGRGLLGLVSVIYLSRAAEEFVFFSVVTWWVVIACLRVGALYASLLGLAMEAGYAEKGAAASA